MGTTKDPIIITMGGLRITPDLSVDELDPRESAMLVLPGADTWIDGGGDNQAFAAAARRFVEAGVPVAAICGATVGLAMEGLLDEREILARLDAYKPETLASWYKLYGQQDATGFFELMAAS